MECMVVWPGVPASPFVDVSEIVGIVDKNIDALGRPFERIDVKIFIHAVQMFGLHFAASSSSPSNSSRQTSSHSGEGSCLLRTTSALSTGSPAEASKCTFSSPSLTLTPGTVTELAASVLDELESLESELACRLQHI